MRRLFCVLLIVGFVVSHAGADEVALPSKSDFHLFLLVGQSNMAGRGKVTDADKVPHPRVLVLNKQNAWEPATDPLHFDKPKIAGVGLGSSFARTLADANPEVTIGLIPCAFGGTPISRWGEGKDLYEAAMVRAKIAMKQGTLKGILWHQGEAECNNKERAEAYAMNLAAMITAMRQELDAPEVPFISGKLGTFLYEQERFPYVGTVDGALEAVEKLVPNYRCVSSDDLKSKSDRVHFDAAAYREFGKRYAKAYLSLK